MSSVQIDLKNVQATKLQEQVVTHVDYPGVWFAIDCIIFTLHHSIDSEKASNLFICLICLMDRDVHNALWYTLLSQCVMDKGGSFVQQALRIVCTFTHPQARVPTQTLIYSPGDALY